jgi:hypothetical protein
VRRAAPVWLACAIGVSAAAVVRESAAEERGRVALDYARAVPLEGTCPDESSFRNLVVARLGYDPFGGDDTPDRIHVVLTLDHGHVAASAALQRAGQSGRAPRTLEGGPGDCEAMVAALATSVAITLDPMHEGAPPPPPPSTPVGTSEPHSPEPPAPEPPSAEPHPPHRSALSVFVSAAPVVSLGLAPSVSLGGEAGVGVRRGQFSLEVLGRAETTPGSAEVNGVRLTASVYSGTLLPCGTVSHVRICGVIRVGDYAGVAPDLVQKQQNPAAFYMSLGLRTGYEIRLSEIVSIEPSLGVEVPLLRPALEINSQPIWSPRVASGTAAVAVHVLF